MGSPLNALSSPMRPRRLQRPWEQPEKETPPADFARDTTTEPAAQGPTPLERPQFEAYQTAVEEMPQLERAPVWRQALGFAAEAFRPTRGTGLGDRLSYRNLDEVSAAQQQLKPLERLAQLEEAQGDQAMRGREAGIRERGVAVDEAESKYPRAVGRSTFDPRTGELLGPEKEAELPQIDATRGLYYTRGEGGVPTAQRIPGVPEEPPKPPTLVRPGSYALKTDEQGNPVAQQIEGLPEREDSQASPTMARFALRIAELEQIKDRTPEQSNELVMLKRAIGLARPERPTRTRTGKNSAGQNVVFLEQDDGTFMEIPMVTPEGTPSPKLEETPGRPTKRKPGSFTMPAAPTGAAPATPSAAPPEARGRLMTKQEFIEDFKREEGRIPSPEEMERLRGQVWQ